MLYRPLGSSNISVSAIGFGAWGIGGRTAGATSYGETDDAVSLRALETAFDQGITFYDTANVYGDGHSEELIGRAFHHCRNSVVIATKAGMLPSFSGFDFSPAALRSSLEASLKRLKTDYVDILQLHNAPPGEFLARPEILRELQTFRKEGKIRAWGFSTKSPAEALQFLTVPETACLQVNYNLLDWRAHDEGLFEKAINAGVGLIARTPLAFGFLGGSIKRDTVFAPDDHRSLWAREKVIAWVDAAEAIFEALRNGQEVIEQSQLALRFCLSSDAIASVIPGMFTPSEVNGNVQASALGPLRSDQLQRVEVIYRRYQAKLV